jgi:hypothetical protein
MVMMPSAIAIFRSSFLTSGSSILMSYSFSLSLTLASGIQVAAFHLERLRDPACRAAKIGATHSLFREMIPNATWPYGNPSAMETTTDNPVIVDGFTATVGSYGVHDAPP